MTHFNESVPEGLDTVGPSDKWSLNRSLTESRGFKTGLTLSRLVVKSSVFFVLFWKGNRVTTGSSC